MATEEIVYKVRVEGTKDQEKQLASLEKNLSELTKERRELNKQIRNGNKITDKQAQRLSKLNTEILATKNRLNDTRQAVLKNNNALRKTGGLTNILAKGFKRVGAAISGAFIGLFAVQKIAQLAGSIVQLGSDISDLRKQVEDLTGVTGEANDKIVSSVKAIGDTFEQDYNEVLVAANTVSKQFDITITEALDKIKIGFAAGSNSSGEFLDILKEYPTLLKEVGLNADQTFAIINEQVKDGVYSDKGIDAIKEAGLRLRELPKATKEALDNIGLSSKEIEKSLTEGSRSIFDVIQQVSNRLDDLPPQSKEVGSAIANIFGGPGEDAGLRYLTTLGDINLEFSELEKNLTETQRVQLNLAEAEEEFNKNFTSDLAALDLNFKKLRTGIIEIINDLSTLDDLGQLSFWDSLFGISDEDEQTLSEVRKNAEFLRKNIGDRNKLNDQAIKQRKEAKRILEEELELLRRKDDLSDEEEERAESLKLQRRILNQSSQAIEDQIKLIDESRVKQKESNEEALKGLKLQDRKKAKHKELEDQQKEAVKEANKQEKERPKLIEQQLSANEKLFSDILKMRDENEVNQLKISRERAKEEIRNAEISEEEKQEKIQQIALDFDQKTTNAKLKNDKERAVREIENSVATEAAKQKAISEVVLNFENQQILSNEVFKNRKLEQEQEFEKRKNEIIEKNTKERIEKESKERQEVFDKSLNNAQSLSDSIFSLNNSRIEREKNRKLKSIEAQFEAGKISQEQLDAERNKIERKAFERKKKLDTAQAFINGALAITRVIADTPKSDFGISTAILVAATAAQTAAQIAVIQRQTFADGGYTGGGAGYGKDHTGHEVAGVVHKNEYVVPQKVLSTPEGSNMVRALEGMRLGQASTTALKGFANGGFTSANAGGGVSMASLQGIGDQVTQAVVNGVGAIKVVNVASETATVNGRVVDIENTATF